MVMGQMRRDWGIILIILVGLLASFVGWGFYRNLTISRRFEGVSIGASDAQVRLLLGRPSWIEPCGKSFGKPKANYAEYIYRNCFAPLLPEYYSVSFDTSGHVVDKYIYESP
jgi:hypothetical protein